MAKDYGKKNSPRYKGSTSKQLMLVLVSFICGYLGALVFDLSSLSHWITTQILAQNNHESPKKQVVQAQLPKPKFEFYTLLANDHRVATGQVATSVLPGVPASTSPSTPSLESPVQPKSTPAPIKPQPLAPKAAYLVQVASFRGKQDAERMKASLTLKGFMVNIATVSQQNTNWYRVVVGPFSSHEEAKKAQIAVARSEHVMGMVRRMDA